jgi:hypothetical protein
VTLPLKSGKKCHVTLKLGFQGEDLRMSISARQIGGYRP